MGRKFLSIRLSTGTYRLFLEDIKNAYKKIKKSYPRIPTFSEKTHQSVTDIDLDKEAELQF